MRDAGVTIDVCAAHGAWFDPHEMRAAIEAVVRRRPPQVDPEVDREIARAEAFAPFRAASARGDIGLADCLEAAIQMVHDIARDSRRR
jgi:hypothetical protein